MDDPTPSAAPTDADLLAHGREILRAEGDAIVQAAESLDDSFGRAVRLIEGCTGSVVVTGIGKAGLVARKVSARVGAARSGTVPTATQKARPKAATAKPSPMITRRRPIPSISVRVPKRAAPHATVL